MFERRYAVPSSERSAERALRRKAQQERDLADRDARLGHVLRRELAAELVDDGLVGRTFLVQPSAERRLAHVQLGANVDDADAVATDPARHETTNPVCGGSGATNE